MIQSVTGATICPDSNLVSVITSPIAWLSEA